VIEEEKRLQESITHAADWKRWGPYLSDRAWGTVREDYSPDGSAWEYFPHDHARSRAYRWNEDGLFGICDRRQYLCFALALWNGNDPIIKERLFGLTGPEGNHGEDVKEYYFYLDSTPTHSYMRALYKYPQAAFPYSWLVDENRRRGKDDPEFELMDTGVFHEDRYFDVFVEYAKVDPEDILIEITVHNRGPEAARLDLLPTLWFRNRWSWTPSAARPLIEGFPHADVSSPPTLRAIHDVLGERFLHYQSELNPEPLFTENDTNNARIFPPHGINSSPYVKDGINNYIITGQRHTVNSHLTGTKAAIRYKLEVPAGGTQKVRLRLSDENTPSDPLGDSFTRMFQVRKEEADAFYATIAPEGISEDAVLVQRQALAGMLWSKQYYNYAVDLWLDGDQGTPPPPAERKHGRNHDWRHLNSVDIFSMPDKWEYPWFAAWDLAFHCIALAIVDPHFAKRQLILMLREWFMHPNGELAAYEWQFGDVNPPVHAWAVWRVYKIEQKRRGKGDITFLEKAFHKLLLNFTWWINRKDVEGRNIFQGGFLGLDNIGVFDRSATLPTGGHLEQSDGTAWMGQYCLNMLRIAMELARHNRAYEDVATKFVEHFLYIAAAMNNIAGDGIALWDDEDSFFYDVLRLPDGSATRLKVRSLVGLLPLLAVETLEPEVLDMFPGFKDRLEWFLNNRPQLANLISRWKEPGSGERRLLALVRGHRMKCLLRRMLDSAEFLSDYGVRALSRYHLDNPYTLYVNGEAHTVRYEPAESHSGLFGGNSNWRGPIWFPVNYLLIESLQKFHHYYGDDFLVEFPTGSGTKMTLWQIAAELSRRLNHLFLKDQDGRRPVFGGNEKFQTDPHWRDYVLFYEYFHGDSGAGLGASHQTGWTGLVAKMIQQSRE
jgi:hypothetical protein